jgi:hypothetical protein
MEEDISSQKPKVMQEEKKQPETERNGRRKK